MVEADKGMFGDMFDAEQVEVLQEYTVGNEDDGVIKFKIKCLEQMFGEQTDCTSRVIWKASLALSTWFNKKANVQYLTAANSVLELGTGTGLLGIYCYLKMKAMGR